MTHSLARPDAPASPGALVPSEVEGPDGITPGDRLRAELGRRLKDQYPGAVTDPAVVAEIRRSFERQRAREVRRPLRTAWRRKLDSVLDTLGWWDE